MNNHFISDEAARKVLKVIALYGTTLIAYPMSFFIISIMMGASLGGPGKGPSPEEPFLLSSSIVCLGNVLLYRNMFGKGKVIKSILLNIPVIVLCMILGKLNVFIFPIYNSL